MSKNLETDKQTMEDLNILGKYKSNSIYSLFNRVVTRGGERLLEQMFLHPLSNADEINKRSEVFKRFSKHLSVFPEECVSQDSFSGKPQRKASSQRRRPCSRRDAASGGIKASGELHRLRPMRKALPHRSYSNENK